MQALLAAFMNPPQDERAFNAWYDEEHVPLRQAVPGFLSAKRYQAPDGAEQMAKYLALYELASVAVLESDGYTRLRHEQSDRERSMLASVPMLARRVFTLELDGPGGPDERPYLLTVGMTPPPGGEDDFVAWYREEHIPMLLEVPGWKRVRLFRQVDGDGPAFMAVHELESPGVFERPEYTAATSTPWRQRIRSSVLRYERNLFALRNPLVRA